MVHKIKLIPDWKQAWKYFSVHCLALGLVILSLAQILGDTWTALPAGLQQKLPHADTLGTILFALGLLGRLLKFHNAAADANSSSN